MSSVDSLDEQRLLGNIFGAYVNQGTLEEAAEHMASVATGNGHREFVAALDWGVAQAERANWRVASCVEQSAYYARDSAEALRLVRQLRTLYLAEYARQWPVADSITEDIK